VLDGLDDIDWEHLRHAHGPADDVPELLRALRAKDRAIRDEALFTLEQILLGGGGEAFPATARAVPFLLELCAAERTPAAGILRLLARVARAGEEARTAARAGTGKLVRLLRERDRRLRLGACAILATFPEEAGRLRGPLGQVRAAATDDGERRAVDLALACLDGSAPASASEELLGLVPRR
jgi:hypothetical protein